MTHIAFTVEEAVAVLTFIQNQQKANLAPVDEAMRAQAIAGIIGIIMAMQEMGYRVARSLKAVSQ